MDHVKSSQISRWGRRVEVALYRLNSRKVPRQHFQAFLTGVNRNNRALPFDIELGVIAGAGAGFEHAAVREEQPEACQMRQSCSVMVLVIGRGKMSQARSRRHSPASSSSISLATPGSCRRLGGHAGVLLISALHDVDLVRPSPATRASRVCPSRSPPLACRAR